jgi:hypothetical protein
MSSRVAAAFTCAIVLAWPASAFGSCVPQTPGQQLRNAAVVFDGVALEGPTETGVQRFRVDRYVKGGGPEIVAVATGVVARPDGTGSTTSVSVAAAAGERWRLYAMRRAGGPILETSVCAGSRRLGGSARVGGGSGANGSGSSRSSAVGSDGGLGRGDVALAALLGGTTLLATALVAVRRGRRA